MTIVGLRCADEDADIRIDKRRRQNARVFERFPRQLKENPLLRVQLHGFARRDAENRRIEAPDVVEDAGRPSVGLAPLAAARMTELVEGKTVRRNLRNRTALFEQQRPELIDRLGTR